MTDPNIIGRILVAVVGGIGSGKSTVVSRMRDLGADVIEADLIGHAVLRPGGAAFDAVAARWPEVVHDGHIDRAHLASVVFSDPDELDALEALTHPAIKSELERRIASSAGPVTVVETPVPAALPAGRWTTVAVIAPLETRVARAVSRGGDEQDVRRRAAAQPSDDDWREAADHVVYNGGSRAELVRAVDLLWRELTT